MNVIIRNAHQEVWYEGKIVIYQWKKAKVIWQTYSSLILVFQEEGQYRNTSGIKPESEQDPHRSSWNNKKTKYYRDNRVFASESDLQLLDKRKNPQRYWE